MGYTTEVQCVNEVRHVTPHLTPKLTVGLKSFGTSVTTNHL